MLDEKFNAALQRAPSFFSAKRGAPIPELGEFIIANKHHVKAFGHESELNRILTAIKLAAKVVNRELKKAGLVDILGSIGTSNVQGEQQQKMDVFANQKFIQSMANREVVCGICSEEDDDFIAINDDCSLVLLMDPLDGSSNIDVNVSVGTIFSIFRRVTPVGTKVEMEDFLQPGEKQICAGYVLYGSSTVLVMSTGHGVHGFTLDPSLGTFFLSHPNLMFPKTANIYSINEGNYFGFPAGITDFLKKCEKHENGAPTVMRYIGSLVSDFHRNMLQGGIYLYPATKKDTCGKLRLLYEANPMSFLAEQAGGRCSNGFGSILKMKPTSLHQRVPFIVGSQEHVSMVEESMNALSPELKIS